MSPEQLRDILRPWALRLMGDGATTIVTKATEAHPLLGSLAADIVATLVTAEHLEKALGLLDEMLRAVVGDDYPAIIEAKLVVIRDERTGPTDGPA